VSKEAQATKIREVASAVGTQPQWLDALINFETGGTYSTTIKNPKSSARGLIQIINASAQDLGYADSLDAVTRNPDFDSQMEFVVKPYLQMWMNRFGPLDTEQKLYMTVFYPKAVTWDINREFPDSVKAVNPGITKPSDYINYVNARVKESALHFPKALPLAGLLVLGLGAYLLLKRRRT